MQSSDVVTQRIVLSVTGKRFYQLAKTFVRPVTPLKHRLDCVIVQFFAFGFLQYGEIRVDADNVKILAYDVRTKGMNGAYTAFVHALALLARVFVVGRKKFIVQLVLHLRSGKFGKGDDKHFFQFFVLILYQSFYSLHHHGGFTRPGRRADEKIIFFSNIQRLSLREGIHVVVLFFDGFFSFFHRLPLLRH